MSGQQHPSEGEEVTVARALGTVHPKSDRWAEKDVRVNAYAIGTMQITVDRAVAEGLYLAIRNSVVVTEPVMSLLQTMYEAGRALGHPPLAQRSALRLEGDPE